MTLYLVTIATDHHQTHLKICARDERTATEPRVRSRVSSLWKNIAKHTAELYEVGNDA